MIERSAPLGPIGNVLLSASQGVILMAFKAAIRAGALKTIGTGRGGIASAESHAKRLDPVAQSRVVQERDPIAWSKAESGALITSKPSRPISGRLGQGNARARIWLSSSRRWFRLTGWPRVAQIPETPATRECSSSWPRRGLGPRAGAAKARSGPCAMTPTRRARGGRSLHVARPRSGPQIGEVEEGHILPQGKARTPRGRTSPRLCPEDQRGRDAVQLGAVVPAAA